MCSKRRSGKGRLIGVRLHQKYRHRPLNLPCQFTVRATHYHSEIGLSHSEICVQLSHDTRTKHDSCRLTGNKNVSVRNVTQLSVP